MAGMNIPDKINDFNVYRDGTRLIGVGEEVTLPDIEMLSETVLVAGGEVDSPTIGQFASSQVEIPFQSLVAGAFDLLNPLKSVNVTLRASQQEMNGQGDIVFVGVRAVFRGRPKIFAPGSVKKGSGTGATLTIEWTYYLLEIDGEKVVEIDKLNGVFKARGVDIMAQSKALC